ncbi:hypothetical protein BH10ACT8_BH10ACT8_10610 [soil metagenome]
MSTRYRMHFNPLDDVHAAARDCEIDVFYEEHHNTPGEWAVEYQDYESTSTFIAITDSDGRAVAVSRLIRPGGPGLKTLVDISQPPWSVDGERSARAAGVDLDSTWDVATIAVRKGAGRSGYLTMALLHGLVLTARANNVHYITMILDGRARRLLNVMGLPNNPLPGTHPAPYAGLPSAVPAWSNIAVMLDHQRIANPEGYRLVAQGVGLDDMTVPDVTAFRLGASVADPLGRSRVLEVA